jgi:hypothetical protein
MEAAEDLRETAIKQIKKRRDFRSHLVIYLLVNLLLWGIWVVGGIADGFGFPWPVFVTGGWGVGLLINAWDTYGTSPITEQEVQAEIERLKERT